MQSRAVKIYQKFVTSTVLETDQSYKNFQMLIAVVIKQKLRRKDAVDIQRK